MFKPLHLSTFCCFCLTLNYFKWLFSTSIYTPYIIMTKQETDLWQLCKFITKCEKKLHLNTFTSHCKYLCAWIFFSDFLLHIDWLPYIIFKNKNTDQWNKWNGTMKISPICSKINGHTYVVLPRALTAVMLRRDGSLAKISSSSSVHCLSPAAHFWHWRALESGSEKLLHLNSEANILNYYTRF